MNPVKYLNSKWRSIKIHCRNIKGKGLIPLYGRGFLLELHWFGLFCFVFKRKSNPQVGWKT